MTENLFRFSLIRPPRRISEQEEARITEKPYEDGPSQFAQILSQQPNAEQVKQIADNYVNSNQFISSFRMLPNGGAVAKFDQWLLNHRKVDVDAWRTAVAGQFPNSPNGSISDIMNTLQNDRLRLADSLMALVVARRKPTPAQELIVRGLRIIGMVKRLGNLNVTARDLQLAQRAIVVLPALGIKLKSPPQPETNKINEPTNGAATEHEKMVKELGAIQGAIREIRELYSHKLRAAQARNMTSNWQIEDSVMKVTSHAPSVQSIPPSQLTVEDFDCLSASTQDVLSGYPLPLSIPATTQSLEEKRYAIVKMLSGALTWK